MILLTSIFIQGSPPEATAELGIVFVIASAILLAAIHLFAGRLHMLDRIPRSRWLSFGGGISVAYVFVHLLPELQEGAEAIEESDLFLAVFFERHVYLVALAGFAVFYGLERLVTRSQQNHKPFGVALPKNGVFWVHIGSFTIYNGLVGYLLHDRDGIVSAVLFTVAMALHFIVNDYGLREDYEHLYHDIGRWIISAAIIAGAVFGILFEVEEAFIAVLVAFLAGGVILNVIKEELPKERESRWWAFVVGAISYTSILLLV